MKKSEQTRATTRLRSEQAKAASCIRKDLKNHFPTVKFWVTSKGYSGGESVRIDWINGPTHERVSKIVKKYQYGRFNPMNDYYDHTNTRRDIPQAKYVQCQRKIHPDVNMKYFEKFKKTHKNWDQCEFINRPYKDFFKEWGCCTPREYISLFLSKEDLTKFGG